MFIGTVDGKDTAGTDVALGNTTTSVDMLVSSGYVNSFNSSVN
jgi:hypothetical protein